MRAGMTGPRVVVAFITSATLFLGAALMASLVSIWPLVASIADTNGTFTQKAENARHSVAFAFGLFSLRLVPATTLLLLVVLMGMLGSFVHVATSVSDFVGNRAFKSSWTVWYLLRPFVGAALAVIFYVAIRGGVFSSTARPNDINPYGLAAIGGLSGLFSKQATDKLREVFETLFHVQPGKGDDQRADDLVRPKPTLTRLDPASIATGATTTVDVFGANFADGTIARLNGVDVATTVVSESKLTVEIPATPPGVVRVTVFIPPPGGGLSDELTLRVAEVSGPLQQ